MYIMQIYRQTTVFNNPEIPQGRSESVGCLLKFPQISIPKWKAGKDNRKPFQNPVKHVSEVFCENPRPLSAINYFRTKLHYKSFAEFWICHWIPSRHSPLKVSNRNTRTRCQICSKWTIRTPERHRWRHSGVFIVNCEYISHPVLVFIVNFEHVFATG